MKEKRVITWATGDGDGEYFEVDKHYYFFDRLYNEVFCASWSENQVTPTAEVCIAGSKIPIRWLRSERNAAITDGQEMYRRQIRALEMKISELEGQKYPAVIEDGK